MIPPATDLVSLAGRRACVTGAAGGIGAAVCARLADAGAEVFATDVAMSDTLAAVRDAFAGSAARARAGTGARIAFRPFDLLDDAGLEACAADVASLGPDVLVNNAALFDMGSVLDADLEQYHRVFGLNVRATYRLMQAAARGLVERGRGGSIINLASQAGRRGEALVAHYCASKAAVISYTQSAALALAPKGIRVNALAPGVVDTPMWDRVDALFARFEGLAIGEKKRQVADANPMGRMGDPEDVARAALFLASDLSAYVTGQTINVDGGNVLS